MKKPFVPSLALVLALLCGCAAPLAEEEAAPPPRAVQTLTVNGTELTGLNAPLIADAVARTRAQGADVLVVDLSSIERMTEAGLAALTDAAAALGPGNFAVVGLAGQPAQVLAGSGASGIGSYPTVDSATEALSRIPTAGE
jgi:anti-anti-sigma regulatory factor